eukprot:5628659-Amphidinium_carterae.1
MRIDLPLPGLEQNVKDSTPLYQYMTAYHWLDDFRACEKHKTPQPLPHFPRGYESDLSANLSSDWPVGANFAASFTSVVVQCNHNSRSNHFVQLNKVTASPSPGD